VITTGDVRKFSSDYKSRQWLDDQHNYTADLVWHVPSVDIRWIGAHQNYKYTQQTDGDFTDVLTMRLPVTFRLVSPGQTNQYLEDREWYSNEVTFTSTNGGAFSWVFGLYQSTEKYHQEPLTSTLPGYPELNNPIGSLDRALQLLGLPPCSPPAFVVGCYNPSGVRTVVACFRTGCRRWVRHLSSRR